MNLWTQKVVSIYGYRHSVGTQTVKIHLSYIFQMTVRKALQVYNYVLPLSLHLKDTDDL